MPLAICAIAALAALAPYLARRNARWGGAALAVAVGAAGALLATAALRGDEVPSFAAPWLPQLGVTLSFRLDGLALLFALLVTVIGALVLVYAWSYLAAEPERGRAVAILLAFTAAMLGLVLADDLVLLYVFWELTSVCSWLLIGFHHDRAEARTAAWQALLVTVAGGLAMLAGFALLAEAAGTWRISRIVAAAPSLAEHPLLPWASGLILAGILTKSGQVPLHGWLPRAMEAPAPVSAYLHAATMVKAGIYLALRFVPVLGASAPFRWGLLAAGAASLIVGSSRALFESDLKRVLAYSTVGALGLLLLLTAVGTPAAIHAALAYTLAHALYKGALFLAAGGVDHGAGTRDTDRLGGLWRWQPITAAAAALAAVSMAGVPSGLGYAAKEAAYAALLETSGRALTLVAVAGSAFFVAAAAVSGWLPFFAHRRRSPSHGHEVSPALWAPPLALALAGMTFGVAPALAEGLVAPAATIVPGHVEPLALAHGGWPAALSAVTLALGAALVWARPRARAVLGPVIGRASLADGFRAFLKVLDAAAKRHTAMLQTGSLRRYLLVTFGVVGALIAGAFARSSDVLRAGGGAPRLPEMVLGSIAVAAAIAAVLSRTRLGAIVALGAVGYAVGLLFLVFGAPDLAMTQIAVETLTVMVLLLAFRHLPRFGRFSSASSRARDVVLASLVGAGMALLVVLAAGSPPDSPVSSYHLANSVPGAHGRNVVNTTLVDFRGLDTLGEVTVLAVAGFGIVALLKLRKEGRP
jgi:multicomponent Na+:H+ antiporter subunit A